MKQGHEETKRKSFQEEQESASSSLPTCSQCLDFWRKISQGTGKGTQESSTRTSLLCSHPASQPSTASPAFRDTVGSYRSTVPEPVLSGCHLLYPSFHGQAVKQLQLIMSCAVAGQTTHRKAWFAETKLLSKLEAFPEKFTVQDEDPHNLVTSCRHKQCKREYTLVTKHCNHSHYTLFSATPRASSLH